MPTGVQDTHSRTRASQEPIHYSPEQESPEMERALTRDAQAACEFSLLTSKSSPFFHSVKRNRCNLACQRQSRHGRLDAFGERALVELLERSGLHTGPGWQRL